MSLEIMCFYEAIPILSLDAWYESEQTSSMLSRFGYAVTSTYLLNHGGNNAFFNSCVLVTTDEDKV
jgi:hypothetical protein